MYAKWLYFFNSPLKEIGVKGKKTKQPAKKEWLDDGSMKISGDLPNEWSITLQPILLTDIYTLKYEIKNDKIEAKDLFVRAFEDRNKDLFLEGETVYKNSEKKEKEINEVVLNNDKILKTILEKIFQIRRNLYFVGLEKPINFKKVKSLTAELEKATLEQIDIQKSIKEQENNYILRTQSIIQKGPFPEPPVVKHLSLSMGRNKLQFEKNIEEEEKRQKELDEEQNKESDKDSDEIINDTIHNNTTTPETNNININANITSEETNKKGGHIKIIKLS